MRCFLAVGLAFIAGSYGQAAELELVEVRKIWDQGRHNAFTDLIRFRNAWVCTFREGDDHAKGAGVIRVIRSADAQTWESVAVLAESGHDLRDPKVSLMPDGRLMLVGGAAVPATRDPVQDHYSFVSFSNDGRDWSQPRRVLESWQWLWRVTWLGNTSFGVAYQFPPERPRTYRAFLCQSQDGVNFEKVVEFTPLNPTEATLRFDGERMIALQRRDGTTNSAMLGTSLPPYQVWSWKDLGHYLGGPNFIRSPSGDWYAAGRVIRDKKPSTVVARLNLEKGKLEGQVILPSAGDNSYPGLVWHDNQLWVSYYSSHEGKASIYLARFRPRPTVAGEP